MIRAGPSHTPPPGYVGRCRDPAIDQRRHGADYDPAGPRPSKSAATRLDDTRLVADTLPDPGAGEAVLQVDAFAFTANNITYAVAGDTIGYWRFFPAQGETDEGWGRIPVWGFGDVVQSNADGVAEGDRFYGYFPMAGHLLVKPQRVSEHGFSDAAAHRAELPPVYNNYTRSAADPAYRADQEAMQMLFRPLFTTSFFLDDFLDDNDFFGAATVLLTSASSKTAFGLAWLLKRNRSDRCRVVGLTSAGNAGFVEGLGCYDQVVAYDDLASLPREPTVLVDMAGNAELRAALHHNYADDLAYSCSVGATHWENARMSGDEPLRGRNPACFSRRHRFKNAPRNGGPQPWRSARQRPGRRSSRRPTVGSTCACAQHGPDAVQSIYQQVLHNRASPSDGFILSL
ncbi:MAG: DUF2855 family protein [Gammaproteobacteria bacterium]|nr:DUF2855 family protein [Gammaproteobacteria bacterium]